MIVTLAVRYLSEHPPECASDSQDNDFRLKSWYLNFLLRRDYVSWGEERAMADTQQREVDRNFKQFQKLLPDLLKQHPGKYALMKDGEVVEVFDTARDAYAAGNKIYSDGLFSIQHVADASIDLGFFSHAFS